MVWTVLVMDIIIIKVILDSKSAHFSAMGPSSVDQAPWGMGLWGRISTSLFFSKQ